MERVSGRSDDMLIIRGVNVFPSQIETILMSIKGLEPHYQLIVERVGTLDTLTVLVEVSEQVFSDEIRVMQSLEKRIAKDIKDYLGVTASIKLVGESSAAQARRSGLSTREPSNLWEADHEGGTSYLSFLKISRAQWKATKVLKESGINIRALSLADVGTRSCA